MSTATIARANNDAGLPRSIEDLLDAATEQGQLTFGQVRRALDEAGVGPADAKKVLRLMSERGIQIGADAPDAAATATPASPVATASGNSLDEDEVVDSWDHEVPTTDLVRVYLTD